MHALHHGQRVGHHARLVAVGVEAVVVARWETDALAQGEDLALGAEALPELLHHALPVLGADVRRVRVDGRQPSVINWGHWGERGSELTREAVEQVGGVRRGGADAGRVGLRSAALR